MANRRRLGPCSFVHVSAVQMPDGAQDAFKCVDFFFFFFLILLHVGVDAKLFSVGCETTVRFPCCLARATV